MATYNVPIWPQYFDDVYNARKTFEVRSNQNSYQTDDQLWLEEYNPNDAVYTGRRILARVVYVMALNNDAETGGLPDTFVVLGIRMVA
jgi:hypothetical protein